MRGRPLAAASSAPRLMLRTGARLVPFAVSLPCDADTKIATPSSMHAGESFGDFARSHEAGMLTTSFALAASLASSAGSHGRDSVYVSAYGVEHATPMASTPTTASDAAA